MDNFSLQSSTGLGNIRIRFREPENQQPRAVMTIMHGMAEHVLRYDDFAGFLAKNGIAVVAADMISHGKSISENGIRGYFGPENGWEKLIEDALNVHQVIKQTYPYIPSILFGHSMGSFLARAYAARHGKDMDMFIFCGTAGHNSTIPVAKLIAKHEIKHKGAAVPSQALNKLAFGAYNKPFEGRTEFDWLSANRANVDRYIEDPLCGFTFTSAGFYDLFTGIEEVSKKDWAKNVPAKPIMVIAGSDDPVGSMGDGPREVASRLTASGHNVLLKLYPNMRHEILNEANNHIVYKDILDFINMNLD